MINIWHIFKTPKYNHKTIKNFYFQLCYDNLKYFSNFK